MTPKLRVGPLCLLILLCSCREGAEPPVVDRLITFDSAGVQVIGVPESYLQTLPNIVVDSTPALGIGGRPQGPESHFGRVTAATRLPGGIIAVLDGQARSVRLFDPDGLFVQDVGGEGRGPGEFIRPVILRSLDGGGFGVYDRTLSRVTVFDDVGGLVETHPVPLTRCPAHRSPTNSRRCEVVGLLADLSIGTQAYAPATAPRAVESGDVEVSPPRRLWVGWGTTEAIDSLDAYQTHSTTTVHTADGSVWFLATPFDGTGGAAWGRDRLVMSSSDVFGIRVWEDRRHVRTVRVHATPISRTPAHLDPMRAWGQSEEASYPVERFLEVDLPDAVPFFGAVVVDQVGRVWLEEYRPAPELLPMRSTTWTVFDDEGVPMARVIGAPSEDVLEIGGDYLLVRRRDALDVESVALLELVLDTLARPLPLRRGAKR